MSSERSRLKIRVFGSLRVERGGKPLEGLHLREGRRLLAYLLLKHREEVTYRHLAERFWPAEARGPVDSGGDMISTRQAIRSLRLALGPDAECLESVGRGRVRLNLAESDVDLFDFDRWAASDDSADWRKAIALYRGPLLEDITDPWTAPARNRRQREYDCLLKQIEQHQAISVRADNGARAGNLPVPLTSFIGREQQIREIQSSLRATRLLTLTGTGGCGKTRLVLRVTEPLRQEYRDGVWFVELTNVSDGALVAQVVAQTLNIEAGTIPELVRALQCRRMLLILDNCEHLLTICRHLCATILSACPEVILLATSREALRIDGERVYIVPPLTVPELRFNGTMDELARYESVRLFVERAAALKSTFTITEQNADTIAQVCWRLDGIPLAIELAAARIRALSVGEINARLNDRFRLLTGGGAMRPPRQQTLRALIDWSYNLLSPTEATVFERFSIFAGGWTLEAAETVVTGNGIADTDVLDLLESLVEKSLVWANEFLDGTRYGMPESIRQYAAEKLAERGDEALLRINYQRYYLSLAENAEVLRHGSERRFWERVLETERDNLRSTFLWSVSQTIGDTVNIISRLGELFGVLPLGRLIRPVAGDQDTLREAEELEQEMVQLTELACVVGRQATRSLLENGFALGRRISDRVTRMYQANGLPVSSDGNLLPNPSSALHRTVTSSSSDAWEPDKPTSGLGALIQQADAAFDQGEYDVAQSLYEKACTEARDAGEKRTEACASSGLGRVALQQHNYSAAHLHFTESNRANAFVHDGSVLVANLRGFGDIARLNGDLYMAHVYYQQILESVDTEGPAIDQVIALEGFALLAFAEGKAEQGILLSAAASAQRQRLNINLPLTNQGQLDSEFKALREWVGDDAFALLWERGYVLSLEDAISLAVKRQTTFH